MSDNSSPSRPKQTESPSRVLIGMQLFMGFMFMYLACNIPFSTIGTDEIRKLATAFCLFFGAVVVSFSVFDLKLLQTTSDKEKSS